ncbi:MAG: nuclear transport factor 2 family protein [Verrucomicrobia bacterium]|nr:nuclear transport factor 2 family protein [Cytophagales bacterium]
MKCLSIILFYSLITLTAAFAQNKTADETAIRKTLTDARAAYDKKDLSAFTAFFVKSPDLYFQIYAERQMIILAHGWEAMNRMEGGYMKENPQPNTDKIIETAYKVYINGNTAWVSSTNEYQAPDGKKSFSQDFIVLEKQQGIWKIAALTSQNYAEGKLVEVK